MSPGDTQANWNSPGHALDVALWLGCPIMNILPSHPNKIPGTGTIRSPGGSMETPATRTLANLELVL